MNKIYLYILAMFKSIKPKKPNKALLIKENSETDETYVIISKLLKKYKKAQKEDFFSKCSWTSGALEIWFILIFLISQYNWML